ncbi:MAG TPA: TIGR00730 family Rossman fold protein, partial [Longimicrobium sp.]|nr:TIGR00730 family Rossman fold protein [Longimicrobium sp.]
MKRVCVFCGSNPGRRPEYLAAAREVGRVLVEREVGLVYGGGKVGLMGAVADAVLAGGGQVTGVIPQALMAR